MTDRGKGGDRTDILYAFTKILDHDIKYRMGEEPDAFKVGNLEVPGRCLESVSPIKGLSNIELSYKDMGNFIKF